MESRNTNSSCPGENLQGEERTNIAFARTYDMPWMSVEDWCRRVSSNLNDPSREGARLVFMGDSITEGWRHAAKDVWDQYFSDYQALSLGVSGDQTQHLLWRLANGEVDQLRPELLVLLIGVNNVGYGGWSEADTAAGVKAVLSDLRRRLPETKIIHLAIFPAGASKDDEFRKKIQRTNELLQDIQIPEVIFRDIGSAFMDADGGISSHVMYDYLHPTSEGYRRWAAALEPELTGLLR